MDEFLRRFFYVISFVYVLRMMVLDLLWLLFYYLLRVWMGFGMSIEVGCLFFSELIFFDLKGKGTITRDIFKIFVS